VQLKHYSERFLEETQEKYFLQRSNDLLAQVEHLKQIDTRSDPELQIKVSLAIKELYEALELLF